MTVLSLNDAGFVTPIHLFQNLNLTINTNDHLGIVAQNGAGKSTLLRCLIGKIELTHGEVFKSRGLRLGYMAQDVDPSLVDLTFFEAVLDCLPESEHESDSWRVDMVLDTFDAPLETRHEKVSNLSGGWQRLMLLARVWITEPDVLLMDEPTNHLDIGKILMLENWLSTWASNMPVIIVSHDRGFLDAVTNRTLFLRPDVSYVFSLSYSRARDELAKVDEAQATEKERQLNEAGRLRRQSAKLKNIGINSGSDLLQKKQKQLRERAEKIEDSVSNLHKDRAGEIQLTNRGTHAKVLVRMEDFAISTPDDRLLFRVDKLEILQGDRVVLLGDNGVGKSTFVRMLLKSLVQGQDVDGVKVTPSLVTGYMDQALSQIPEHQTPFDYIAKKDSNDAHARSSLASAGILFDLQDKPIKNLSFGQKSRLALLALRFEEPNFYLLDEPTTHVDISGQETLAEEINTRGAACVLVSHDRAFVHDVGSRFLQIDKGKLIEVASADNYFAKINN